MTAVPSAWRGLTTGTPAGRDLCLALTSPHSRAALQSSRGGARSHHPTPGTAAPAFPPPPSQRLAMFYKGMRCGGPGRAGPQPDPAEWHGLGRSAARPGSSAALAAAARGMPSPSRAFSSTVLATIFSSSMGPPSRGAAPLPLRLPPPSPAAPPTALPPAHLRLAGSGTSVTSAACPPPPIPTRPPPSRPPIGLCGSPASFGPFLSHWPSRGKEGGEEAGLNMERPWRQLIGQDSLLGQGEGRPRKSLPTRALERQDWRGSTATSQPSPPHLWARTRLGEKLLVNDDRRWDWRFRRAGNKARTRDWYSEGFQGVTERGEGSRSCS